MKRRANGEGLDKQRHAYATQRSSASKRGIEWQFTYEEWLDWWGNDYVKRGKSKNSLCMARYNDCGPYSYDNCYKATISSNLRDFHTKGKDREKWGQLRKVNTPAGTFPSVKAAAIHYNVTGTTMQNWIRKKPEFNRI